MQDDAGLHISTTVLLWVIGGISTVFSWLLRSIWSRHTEEITALKLALSSKLNKEDYEQNRREVREGIQKLDEKIDDVDSKAEQRHNTIMGVLLSMKNGGK